MRIEQASSLVIKTFAVSLCLLMANGCRKDRDRTEAPSSAANQRPVEPAATYPSQQNAQQQNAQQPDPDLGTATIMVVDIDPRLATVCAIAPINGSFKFDSASPTPEAKERLDLIAECVTTGVAKGKALRVVGHPDTTGSDTYNQQMGKSRAEAVSEYLRTRGVQGQRVESEIKAEQPGATGATGATGPTAMPGWIAVRRVTIRLVES